MYGEAPYPNGENFEAESVSWPEKVAGGFPFPSLLGSMRGIKGAMVARGCFAE